MLWLHYGYKYGVTQYSDNAYWVNNFIVNFILIIIIY